MKAFLDRPIEGDWPYLWIDATYVKVHHQGRVLSVAVIVALGDNSDGRREVLGLYGLDICAIEAEIARSTPSDLPRAQVYGMIPRFRSSEGSAWKTRQMTGRKSQ